MIADKIAGRPPLRWWPARFPSLPRLVPAAQLPAADGSRPVPIGIAEADLEPVTVDFDADPHLIAFGDNESGKSGLMRLLARRNRNSDRRSAGVRIRLPSALRPASARRCGATWSCSSCS